MTCNEREELLIAYAADALDAPQQEEFRAHLEGGCERCNAALNEARIMLDQIPTTIPPVAPPSEAVTKLMQRVKIVPGKRMFGFKVLALAASLGLVIGAVAMHFYAQDQRNELMVALADKDARLQDLQNLVQSQELKLVAFSAPENAGKGRLLWDKDRNRWHVYVFDMKPPPPGRTFELWYIKPDQTKIRAGEFDVDESGKGSLVVQIPQGIGEIAVAAITDEPIGGVAQPTGAIRLVSNVQ